MKKLRDVKCDTLHTKTKNPTEIHCKVVAVYDKCLTSSKLVIDLV